MKRNVLLLATLVLGCACISAEAGTVLGTASDFAVLGATTVTNTGVSTIDGDVGVSPGSAVTGFPPGVVTNGTIHENDAIAIQAQADANTAFVALGLLPVTQDLTGTDLGGLTLTPGVYFFSSAAQLTGTLTLDGQGQSNPMFVFQIGTALTTASASSILWTNGADPSSIYFRVESSATLGAGTAFAGTIIASESVTLVTGASVIGRVIGLNGAVTLDTNHIEATEDDTPLPIPEVVPLPSAAIAGAVLLAGLMAFRSRRSAVVD